MKEVKSGLFAVLLGLSICGLSACTEPGQTTGLGAATGGVIGAGLGAIVGSQTGSAGTGLVIGSVAGASAGGLVGNALEAQDKAIRTQDEALERQQRIMQAQRNEIEELRRGNDSASVMSRDLFDRSAVTSKSSVALLTPEDERIKAAYAKARFIRDNEDARIASKGNELVVASRTSKSAAGSPRVPSKMASKLEKRGAFEHASAGSADWAAPKKIKVKSTKETYAKKSQGSISAVKKTVAPKIEEPTSDDILAPAAIDAAPVSDAIEIAERDLATPTDLGEVQIAESKKSITVEPSAPAKGAYDWSKGANEEENPLDEPTQKTSALKEASGSDCDGAVSEIQNGENSQETADKLFHFRRALRLCPSRPDYHVKLGRVYLALNRPTDAVYEFKEALTLDPSHAAAKEGLASLGR